MKNDQPWRDGYKAFQIGEDLLLKEQFQEALHYFDTAINSGSEGTDVYAARGSCLQSLEFHLDAIDDFTKAIGFNPADSNLYFMRSLSKGATGDLQGRVADLQEAIRVAGIDNASSRALNALANERGYKDGIVGKYQMDLMHANLDLERQADDEHRRMNCANSDPILRIGGELRHDVGHRLKRVPL